MLGAQSRQAHLDLRREDLCSTHGRFSVLEIHITASEDVARLLLILLLAIAVGSCRKEIRRGIRRWISGKK
jgi:hypothetical protein